MSEERSRMSPLSETSIPTSPELRLRYEQLIDNGATDYDCLEANIKQLKELILAHGIPVRLFPLHLHLPARVLRRYASAYL